MKLSYFIEISFTFVPKSQRSDRSTLIQIMEPHPNKHKQTKNTQKIKREKLKI